MIARYGAVAAAGDIAELAATLHGDAVWHQPGRNQLSGDHAGPDAIVAHLGRFMELNGETFRRATLSVAEAGVLSRRRCASPPPAKGTPYGSGRRRRPPCGRRPDR
ncbi:nuclear transport factor 2 family protein [Agromyces ramosus]|uniref:nuclear transport factor 2 family protein n=1 Tax=Agromyces ramosus TaxID=33879 RepID=UPI003BF7E8A9